MVLTSLPLKVGVEGTQEGGMVSVVLLKMVSKYFYESYTCTCISKIRRRHLTLKPGMDSNLLRFSHVVP